VRVTAEGRWAFASRDVFKANSCEHCLRLAMAVKAGVPSVVARVAPYIEDLGTKLPIIQGNEREAQVFEQLRQSLPEGQFLELSGANPTDSVAAMSAGVPVIAQAYFKTLIGGYEWSGFADLLVLDGYEIQVDGEGLVSAQKSADGPAGTKYQAWDVKNSSQGDPKYPLQLAAYQVALAQLGFASDADLGIILGFRRGLVRYPVSEALSSFQSALERLTGVLALVTPETIDESFVRDWACAKKSMCVAVYCDYPELCAAEFKARDVLELLPRLNPAHGKRLRESGYQTVGQLAAQGQPPVVTGVDQRHIDRYWNAARLMLLERGGVRAYQSLLAGKAAVPGPNQQDIYFDVEWFNLVDEGAELVFMFGAVDSAEDFTVFTADDRAAELQAFDNFLDYAMAKLLVSEDMHIYHYHDPEPQKLRGLAARFAGHRQSDVEALCARMVDLKKVVEKTLLPGSASYSIKKLEKYYDADAKLNRNELVAGGADAMYQFHLYLQALQAGSTDEAATIMDEISAYNKDDCLSTKLLADWLRSLDFAAEGQVVTLG